MIALNEGATLTTSQSLIETVTTLARIAKFIFADLTRAMVEELRAIVPDVAVPVHPIMLAGDEACVSFPELKRRYYWVLDLYSYYDEQELISDPPKRVRAPAERKRTELRDP